MPLPTKSELVAKYESGKIPVMTRADVERQRAEREKWWAELEEEENKAREQAKIQTQSRDNLSSRDTGDESPQILAGVTRRAQSIYGSLKSAKKRKRDPGKC